MTAVFVNWLGRRPLFPLTLRSHIGACLVAFAKNFVPLAGVRESLPMSPALATRTPVLFALRCHPHICYAFGGARHRRRPGITGFSGLRTRVMFSARPTREPGAYLWQFLVRGTDSNKPGSQERPQQGKPCVPTGAIQTNCPFCLTSDLAIIFTTARRQLHEAGTQNHGHCGD